MPGPRNSKKSRYNAIFAHVAHTLVGGARAVVRPETARDYRTICNYWYEWRKIFYGQGIKSADPETRRRSAIILDAAIKIDTDDFGRVVLVIEPYITPQVQHLIEQVIRPEPEAYATGTGTSAPSATQSQASHYMEHTKPWQDWFRDLGPLDRMLRCLDTLPREMRANPDLATLDDLPLPASPEALALMQRFKEVT